MISPFMNDINNVIYKLPLRMRRNFLRGKKISVTYDLISQKHVCVSMLSYILLYIENITHLKITYSSVSLLVFSLSNG